MRVRTGLVLASVLIASGCGGETTGPPEPTPGLLTVSLAAPAGVSTGALVFTITGPGAVTNVAAASGQHVYSRPATSGVKVGVFGTIAAGAVVRFHVPDTRQADEYAATLVEAAGTDNALKPLTGYTLSVSD
jgi:hypothetical protein